MKRIIFLGALMVLTVLVSPNLVFSAPAGPPEGLDVKVINDSTEPVPVSINAGETVQVSERFEVVNVIGYFSEVNYSPYYLELYTVPEGKILKITDATASACFWASCRDSEAIKWIAASIALPITKHLIFSSRILPVEVARHTEIYVNGGEVVKGLLVWSADEYPPETDVYFTMTFSGILVDAN